MRYSNTYSYTLIENFQLQDCENLLACAWQQLFVIVMLQISYLSMYFLAAIVR